MKNAQLNPVSGYRGPSLILFAAVSLALAGCSTKSGQNDTASVPPAPSVELKSEDHVAQEVVVTGSRIPQLSRQAEQESLRKRRAEASTQTLSIGNAAELSRHVVAQPSAADAPAFTHYVPPTQNTENYAAIERNAIQFTLEQPVSTFSIDVDTGAYANVRRFLNNDQLPPQDAVRVEELINYFTYDYPTPTEQTAPFSVSTELSPTPWNTDTWLLQVGLKGYEVPAADRPAANLVFLLDVSGSMNAPDKLPLLKKAFTLLTRQLNADDRISMVVYAGASGVVLEPTPGNEHRAIRAALRKLQAGGSTNGADGIELAYQVAEEAFIENGINRIILATDGDFNVGTVSFDALKDMAERKRKTGVSLTTLGFGTGNYNDHLMEQLADAGNGNYAYIDSAQEARKVLVNEVTSTLHTIAKDVKIQIEFNPDVVAEYRLIGYENRLLNREDFTNDNVDAGEIGAGHTVTALYELVPVDSKTRSVIPLRYQRESVDSEASSSRTSLADEAAFVRLRYKQPDEDSSTELSQAVNVSSLTSLNRSSDNLRFGASVAAFGQLLNGSAHLGNYTFDDVSKLAHNALAKDTYGYRREFLELVATASELFDDQPNSSAQLTD